MGDEAILINMLDFLFERQKFVGRLIRKPERTYGFTTMVLALDSPDVIGVNEAHALLDPKVLDTKEAAKEALNWSAGDLVRIEGQVVKIGQCECCGNAIPVVGAFKCFRVGH